jgi:hypothetical protein
VDEGIRTLEQAAKTIDVIVEAIDEDVGTLIDLMPSIYDGFDFETAFKKLETTKQGIYLGICRDKAAKAAHLELAGQYGGAAWGEDGLKKRIATHISAKSRAARPLGHISESGAVVALRLLLMCSSLCQDEARNWKH